MPRVLLGVAVLVIAQISASTASAQTDQQIAQQVAANLKRSGMMKNYRVGVQYSAGTAVLVGEVANESQRRIALQIAENSPRVKVALDRLTVKAPAQLTSAQRPTPQSALRQPGSLGSLVNAAPQQPSRTNNLQQGLGRIFGGRQQATPNRGTPMPLGPAASTAGRPQAQKIPVGYGHDYSRPVGHHHGVHAMPASHGQMTGAPIPSYAPGGGQVVRTRFDQPHLPPYAWPSYAAHPNYAAVTYPQQYSPTAWPYIGPFYPYPQVPLGWRKVQLEWDDGWWRLKFINKRHTNY